MLSSGSRVPSTAQRDYTPGMGWLKRLRGAVGIGVTWAVAWALAGVAIGVGSRLVPWLPWDAFFRVFDAPLPALAIPGCIAGVFFSALLGIAERGRRVHELSLRRLALWGAGGGLLVLATPFVLVALGLASRAGSSLSTIEILAAIGGPFVLLSTAAACATLALVRRAKARDVAVAGGVSAPVGRGRVDELAEQMPRVGVGQLEDLRMPLHAHDERIVHQLDRLDESVRSDRRSR